MDARTGTYGLRPGGWLARMQRAYHELNKPRLARLILAMLTVLTLYKFGVGAAKYTASTTYALSFPALLALIAGTLVIAWLNRWLRFSELWLPLHILTRAAGAVILAQVVFDALYPSAWQSHVLIGLHVPSRFLIGLALAVGILSQYRPAFLLPFGICYFAFRYHIPLAYGMARTSLDFQVLGDVATFPAAALIAWSMAHSARKWLPAGLHQDVTSDVNHRSWQKAIWGICVGVHLGNYFHSAMAKMYVGGADPLFWLFRNPTYNTISLGLFRLNNPLAGWPDLLNFYFNLMEIAIIPMNIAVFLIQLLSPLSVVNRRLLIIFTLAFDCMHVGIYLALGAFFFFWIALNVIIIASLAKMRDGDFSLGVKIIAVVSSFWGYFFFYQAPLGWLDGRKVVRQTFYAYTADGGRVLVPPVTLGIYAYQMAHGDLYIPAGHHRYRAGGNATAKSWNEASNCLPSVVGEQAFVSLFNVERALKDSDRFLRLNPWVKSWGLFYWYPHHSPSNPAFFDEYDRISMEDIVGYSYMVESACLVFRSGGLQDDIKVKTELKLDVP